MQKSCMLLLQWLPAWFKIIAASAPHKFLQLELDFSNVKSRCDFFHVLQRSLFSILPNLLRFHSNSPQSPPLLDQVSIHFLQLHLQKGGLFSFFVLRLTYCQAYFPPQLMKGRTAHRLICVTYEGKLTQLPQQFFLTPPRRKIKGTRGNDKQTSLLLTWTCEGLNLSAAVIRLCRTLTCEKTQVSIVTWFGIIKTLKDEWFCGTRVVSQMLWE